MNWKKYFKDVFAAYRQEFNKFNEEEKALVQLNITFSQPCQIEVLEFLNSHCQAFIVTFYDDLPDMTIVVHTEIKKSPEQFVQELVKKKEKKWSRFNPQQLQNIVQAIKNCSKGKHWSWSSLSERACIYAKIDFEELNSKKFVSIKINEALQQINMKKRNKQIEDAIPIPLDSIPKSDGKILIKFSLPFELVKDGDYHVLLQGHIAEISIHNISVDEHFEKITGFKIVKSGGGHVKLEDDIRGISTVSEVEILIPFLTDEIYFLQLTLEYLNRLLDVWRFLTGKFWLKEAISDRDIVSVNWEKRYPSGKIRRGMFAFGMPGQIRVPTNVRKTSNALPQISQFLINETRIPLFQILKLNALNHYIERKYNLAIIEMNIALEDYTVRYIAERLSKRGLSRKETDRKLGKYDTFHKMLDSGLKDVAGRSLKDNRELWVAFNRMRTIRKNAIHPFIRKTSYKDATDTFNIANKIAGWISAEFTLPNKPTHLHPC